jgi:hypothetical protein
MLSAGHRGGFLKKAKNKMLLNKLEMGRVVSNGYGEDHFNSP